MKGITRKRNKTEFILDGRRLKYHGMSKDTLQFAKKYYSKMIYVGTSNEYYVNGIKQGTDSEYHFFVRKQLKA